jgi:hypothetical protein
VALAWLVAGPVIVVVSPALVRRIGLHLEENEGLRVEERAGAVTGRDLPGPDVGEPGAAAPV